MVAAVGDSSLDRPPAPGPRAASGPILDLTDPTTMEKH
jgi:hypothetical protein